MFEKVDLSLRTNNTKRADTSKEPLTWNQFPPTLLHSVHLFLSALRMGMRVQLFRLGWFISDDLFTYINGPLSNIFALINLPSECDLCEELGADLVFTKKDSRWSRNCTTGDDLSQLFFHRQKLTNVSARPFDDSAQTSLLFLKVFKLNNPAQPSLSSSSSVLSSRSNLQYLLLDLGCPRQTGVTPFAPNLWLLLPNTDCDNRILNFQSFPTKTVEEEPETCEFAPLRLEWLIHIVI